MRYYYEERTLGKENITWQVESDTTTSEQYLTKKDKSIMKGTLD